MNPITSIVLNAMVDAAQSLKLSTLSMGVSRQARARDGGDGTDQAGTYANTMHSAIQSSLASQEALKQAQAEIQAQDSIRQQQLRQEAQAEARKLDRARRRQALEEAKAQAREADALREDGGGQDSGEDESSGQDGAEQAAPEANSTCDAPNPPEGAAAKGVLYTHRGTVKGKSPENKLTYTA